MEELEVKEGESEDENVCILLHSTSAQSSDTRADAIVVTDGRRRTK